MKNLAMIELVLWDIDGTLLDFDQPEKLAIKKCFEKLELGVCTDEMVKDYNAINKIWWERLERKEFTKPEILVGRFKEFFSKYGVDVSKAGQFNDLYQMALGDTIFPNRNALETLEALNNKGIHQVVVTNGTKTAQDKKLTASGIIKLVEHIYISDCIGFEKPTLEFFAPAFKDYPEISKDRILIVGDSLTSDIQGGINVGIKTCWYNPKGLENKKGLKPTYEITDVAQVLELVNI